MIPVLLNTGFVTIYTYGLFVVLALFWFLYLAWKSIRITKHKEEEIFDRILGSIFIGLVAGRIAYMLFHIDLIVKKGIIVVAAIHLYPGIHGTTVIVVASLVMIILMTRGKKYSGLEIITYLTPAIFVAMAILSIGSVFAGTDVGIVTQFPIRMKFALYDGLRHIPGLYEAIIFLIASLVFNRLILSVRQGKINYGLVVALFFWVISFVHIGTSQLRDIITYQKLASYRSFDLYFAIITLLTSLILVMYYVRSYLFGMFEFLIGRHKNHG